ncbi:MAG: DUF2171 domain-containing protein [Anaerolineae bacterium]|nr:DUF2171 domain-containing protein [Anaerolineae bacterium]
MQFKQGANVSTYDGKSVGSMDRVVLNPKTKEVTHIVVRKGFLFSEDKIIPLDLVASATEDKVTLRQDATDLDKLSPFEEVHYVPLDETEARAAEYPAGWAMPFYWNQPLAGSLSYPDYAQAYVNQQPYRSETEKNIPEDTVALKEGARVISDDDQHVGNVDRVFTQSENDRASHFLISAGLIFKDHKLVPTTWIHDIQEDEVHLNVSAATLKNLPEYQETTA